MNRYDRCPKCGSPPIGDSRFCLECGTDLAYQAVNGMPDHEPQKIKRPAIIRNVLVAVLALVVIGALGYALASKPDSSQSSAPPEAGEPDALGNATAATNNVEDDSSEEAIIKLSATSESVSSLASTTAESASADAEPFEQRMRAAYAGKIREMIDQYGEPGIDYVGGSHSTGLVYAKLLDFGAGYDYLYVGYYDPSFDINKSTPGGYPESYRVEIWAYEDWGLIKVFSDCASQEGQNTYCSAFSYFLDNGIAYVTNGNYTYGPQYSESTRLWGISDEGSFCVLHTSHTHQMENGRVYNIDSKSVSEEEYKEAKASWPQNRIVAYAAGSS